MFSTCATHALRSEVTKSALAGCGREVLNGTRFALTNRAFWLLIQFIVYSSNQGTLRLDVSCCDTDRVYSHDVGRQLVVSTEIFIVDGEVVCEWS